MPFGIRFRGFPAWLSWLFLHLVLLVGFRNRLSVLLNWAWNYVTWDRAARVVPGPVAPSAIGAEAAYARWSSHDPEVLGTSGDDRPDGSGGTAAGR